MPDNNGWSEWSKHVLKELERLNDNQEVLRTKIEEVQQSIVELKTNKTGVDELKTWKQNMDEVTSPTQLKELQIKVADLEQFKTKAVTVFIVLQTIFGIVLAILSVA